MIDHGHGDTAVTHVTPHVLGECMKAMLCRSPAVVFFDRLCNAQVLRLGNMVPDFKAETTQGPMHWHEWINDSWAILFSHPADFTVGHPSSHGP